MMSASLPESLFLSSLRPTSAACHLQLPCIFLYPLGRKLSPPTNLLSVSEKISSSHGLVVAAGDSTLTAKVVPILLPCSLISVCLIFSNVTLILCHIFLAKFVQPTNGVYTVGDFMTKKEHLHVVKPTTTVNQALEILVENRVTGFPVIDDEWKLVGLVSDYDLLALDSVSGTGRSDTDMFPEVDSTWKIFNEVQKLLSKTNGKVVGDLMTPAPLVVREATNLDDAARLLLKTKYRRLPVIDGDGKLVGIITRGNVVRAALQIKQDEEKA